MITAAELIPPHATIETVQPNLPQIIRSQPHDVVDSGEVNHVLVFDTCVVKIPRGEPFTARELATFEAYMIAALNDADSRQPLAIPGNFDFQLDAPPYFVIFSKVPSLPLTTEQVRKFSSEEKWNLGWKIGTLSAWLTSAVSLEQYKDIIRSSGAELPDRTNNILRHARYVREGLITDRPLATLLQHILAAHKYYGGDGLFRPTMVGHDDLRPENMTFVEDGGEWGVQGVFDFGIAKPLIPERDFRHLPSLGPEVIEAAVASYQEQTGHELSRQLIGFWAVAQTATAYSYMRLIQDVGGMASTGQDLDYLLSQGYGPDGNHPWRAPSDTL